jgi:hypothetical protein
VNWKREYSKIFKKKSVEKVSSGIYTSNFKDSIEDIIKKDGLIL